jgi:hypothetical protein
MLLGPSSLSLFSRRLLSHYLFARVRLATSHTTCRNPTRRMVSTCDPPQTVTDNATAPGPRLMTHNLIEDIEPLWRYGPGGYYPVRIGERFASSRYQVVHKLGHGASSTIWLARDEHLAKYVAIKVAVSELDRPFESAVLRTLRDGEVCPATADAGMTIIPEILDEFEMEGPEIQGVKAKHHCLVTTPASMSIVEAREASDVRLFQPAVAQAIAAQLIQAVAFMHSRGIIHAGR